MVDPRTVIQLVNGHVTNLLDVAEAALPPSQFEAFRRICLKEFGDKGLGKELRTLLQGGSAGVEGNGLGRKETGRKGGPP